MTALVLCSFLVFSCSNPVVIDSQMDQGLEVSRAVTANLRLMAANLTSGSNQSYSSGEGARILKGVKPDVVCLQEFNYGKNTTAEIRSFVDSTFGTNYSYYREPSTSSGDIPNGIVSKYPILSSGEWDDASVANRDFAWARIDIPGTKDLWVVSLHILTAGTSQRQTEAKQLVAYIKSKVPSADYLMIAGDFNTGSRTEPCFTTFSQVVSVAGPYPKDQNGKEGTNASRAKPYDCVLVDADLLAYSTATLIGTHSFSSGLVVDTRVSSPYSILDHIAPALSGDSAATNMQHMGVVKDFAIPTN